MGGGLRGSSPTSTRELTNSGTASGGGELGWGIVGKNNNTDTEDNTGSSLKGLDVRNLRAGGGLGGGLSFPIFSRRP